MESIMKIEKIVLKIKDTTIELTWEEFKLLEKNIRDLVGNTTYYVPSSSVIYSSPLLDDKINFKR